MDDKFLKPYNHKEVEDNIYKLWENSGFFNPDNCIKEGICDKKSEKFSMVLPPPNVTGQLHAGHSLMITVEDIMARFNRMLGKRTLWLPGTDHAAIATQSKVEKLLAQEKVKKHDLGREKFLERVEEYAQESHDTIINQTKKMGASLDWSREAYTLDEARQKAVYTAFKTMYDGGLIYRGDRVVNWDPKGQTVISDDEVVHEERKAILYTFKYSKDFPISISTTRPETKVGDTAVAVNPKDKRYKEFVGKTYRPNFCGTDLEIKIIEDNSVDMEFGTGALGVTPSHSMADYELSIKHDLPMKTVINEYAKMELGNPELDGKKTTEAREIIVEWLKENKLLEKEEEIDQNISTAERTGAIIEPLPKLQWFIDVNKEFEFPHNNSPVASKDELVSLKELMVRVVKNKDIVIIPDRFKKTYLHWGENLHDWCISRQIWYGHRVPVWYKGEELKVSHDSPGEDWKQDEDSLDTWFSSGLWTFSTLGWPEQTDDFKDYHPTDMLETAYDILPIWVAKMVLMTTYLIGDIPFKEVYIHGLVRDARGQKLSKSLGNVMDPIEIIENYGADALRMALIVGVGPGQDSNFSPDKAKAYKKFANKLWNVTRFILTSTEGTELDEKFKDWSKEDERSLGEQNNLIQEITKEMNEYKFHLVSEKLYHYVWHNFADIILEESKEIFEGDDQKKADSRKQFLLLSLKNILISLHPFMPFITEEIWQTVKFSDKPLLVTKWPIQI